MTEYPVLEGASGARSATAALGDGHTGSGYATGRGLGFGRAIGVADSPAFAGVGVTLSEPGAVATMGATGALGVGIDADWLGC